MKTGGLSKHVPSRSVKARPVTRIQKTEDLVRRSFWWTPRIAKAIRLPTTPAMNITALITGFPFTSILVMFSHDLFESMFRQSRPWTLSPGTGIGQRQLCLTWKTCSSFSLRICKNSKHYLRISISVTDLTHSCLMTTWSAEWTLFCFSV